MAGNDASHSLNKHMDMIIQDINFYNKYVNSSLKTMPDLISAIETQTPEQVRERYNAFFNMIENREVTFTEHLGKLETSITSLKQIKKIIKDQILPEYEKIKNLINKKKWVHYKVFRAKRKNIIYIHQMRLCKAYLIKHTMKTKR
jgi:hypothetical protein